MKQGKTQMNEVTMTFKNNQFATMKYCNYKMQVSWTYDMIKESKYKKEWYGFQQKIKSCTPS